MKDKKVAKYMKKLAKSVHEDLHMNFPKDQIMEAYKEEDFNDLLLTLQSCKHLFKWHTTRDRWHEVDGLTINVKFVDVYGDFEL